MRERLGRAHGAVFGLAGQDLPALPRALDLAARLYQLDAPLSDAAFRALAEPWRPLRTWAVVLVRAAAGRVLGGAGASADVR